MKLKTMLVMLVSVFMLVSLIGCKGSGSDDSTADTGVVDAADAVLLEADMEAALAAEPTELEGEWESQCYYNEDNDDEKRTMVFTGRKGVISWNIYHDSVGATCTGDVSLTAEWVFIMNAESQATVLNGIEAVKTLTHSTYAFIFTPKTETVAYFLNQAEWCGISNWEAKIGIDVAGSSCGGSPMPSKRASIFDIYQINGDTLRVGDENSASRNSELDRPTRLGMSFTLNHQEDAQDQPLENGLGQVEFSLPLSVSPRNPQPGQLVEIKFGMGFNPQGFNFVDLNLTGEFDLYVDDVYQGRFPIDLRIGQQYYLESFEFSMSGNSFNEGQHNVRIHLDPQNELSPESDEKITGVVLNVSADNRCSNQDDLVGEWFMQNFNSSYKSIMLSETGIDYYETSGQFLGGSFSVNCDGDITGTVTEVVSGITFYQTFTGILNEDRTEMSGRVTDEMYAGSTYIGNDSRTWHAQREYRD